MGRCSSREGVRYLLRHGLRSRGPSSAASLRQIGRRDVGQPQPHGLPLARVDRQAIVRRRLRSLVLRIDRVILAVNDAVVDAVLDVGRAIGNAENTLRVRFVFGEQHRHFAFAVEIAVAKFWIHGLDDRARSHAANLLQVRPVGWPLPRPLVAEPERRQHVNLGRLRTAIVDCDLDQDVVGRLLGVLDEDVEIAILVEDARVEQLVFKFLPAAGTAGIDKVGVGKRRLRILVQIFHVRMGRRAVEVEVILLDVFAVVAFAVRQTEQAFFENWIFAVPEGQREAEPLLVVGDAGQAVFAPAIGARAGLIVARSSPKRCPLRCSPRGRFPIAARSDRVPISSRAPRSSEPRRVAVVPRS